MRTFSRLRAFCAYSEQLERPSRRRDAAAAEGTKLHRYVEQWVRCAAEGRPFHFDGAASDQVRGWLQRLTESWTPPAGLEMEVPLGLAAGTEQPEYVAVDEPADHRYVPASLGITTATWAAASEEQRTQWQATLLTAGRADLVAPPRAGVVAVDDIKTGQSYLGDPKLLRQLLAQGIAATLRAGAEGFVPGIYYARLGIWDRGDAEPIWRDSHEWDQAWDWVVEAAQMPAQPQPGAWCLSCWEKDGCEGYPGREAA
ncbi:MAG TPA: hypothetical protein VJ140_10160 [Actinomycetota bacterium]|nr:hypothetical protein [Actinomycetota bacterium]